jgi:hypothetical protein
VLEFGGNFNKYITSRGLQKQEGVIFRHLLRLILLVKEFQQFTPPDCVTAGGRVAVGGAADHGELASHSRGSLRDPQPPTSNDWLAELRDISDRLADCCRRVDPTSTDKAGRGGPSSFDVGQASRRP